MSGSGNSGGTIEPENVEGGIGFAQIGITGGVGTALTKLLLCEDLVPGSSPSYEMCKIIYVYHPLGAKMAEGPINMAQSQKRNLSVPGHPEGKLIKEFEKEWEALGKIGADQIIKQVMTIARVYGIASLGVGDRKKNPSTPLSLDELPTADLYFSVFDPLNTAGSLTLEQNPNSPDFLKPGNVTVGGLPWHQSRLCVMMNEQPIYLEWSTSAFGFVGRSVYQRALYPMKTFVQSMITDQYVTVKVGLLIAKIKGAAAFVNRRMMAIFGIKRQQLKDGITGNVLSVGHEDSIESLNFQNLEGPARFARENCLKNIATAAGMPARMLDQETMVSGFGEGQEDAKQIAKYVDRMRIEMQQLYEFCDDIVMRRAWSPAFYETLKKDVPSYKNKPYLTAFMEWKNAFKAEWPNLLEEPDSKKAEVADVQFKATIAAVEVMAPLFGPINRANLARWVADQIKQRTELFSAALVLDEDELDNPPPEVTGEGEGDEGSEKKMPKAPPTFAARS